MYFLKINIAIVAMLSGITGSSQSRDSIAPPRKTIHANIDRVQQTVLNTLDSRDSVYTLRWNKKIEDIQSGIENNPSIENAKKIRFLKGLYEILNDFHGYYKIKELRIEQLPILIDAFQEAMNLEVQNSSIFPVIRKSDIRISRLIAKCIAFENNIGILASKEFLVIKEYQKNPKKILPVLYEHPEIPFTDSLLTVIARIQPEEVYVFAQAVSTPLGRKINNSKDPVIRRISQLAGMKQGRLYFPFLDDLVSGKISMTEINRTLGEKNKANYYKLLVKTQIGYTRRFEKGDSAIAFNSLMTMLERKAVSDFINVVNELHDRPDNIRLRVLDSLSPEDLYYLCITGDEELYTSSYVKIYNLIFQRMKSPDSYALLTRVHFDHFKRFIKMASNYNTLDDFLNRMDNENAETIIKSFVNRLEDRNRIEDAVDVADSYASIENDSLRRLMLEEVQKNLALFTKNENTIGRTIYGLLNTLFLSLDSSKNIDIPSVLGIPGVYYVNNNSLQDSSGKIIVQQFFYGDSDGNNEFNNFVKACTNPNWKIVRKAEWLEFHSMKGHNIVVYANKPLDEEKELDTKAQVALGKYLAAQALRPSIVIHRGHSYYVKSTIQQLPSSAKVVLLGSCGGYNNLSQVLKTCPYVHIIATKQEGSGRINQPMIIYILELLRQGKNLHWPEIWKEFEKKFIADDRFDDYIPPHQNLGAIFIMAFNKVMEGDY